LRAYPVVFLPLEAARRGGRARVPHAPDVSRPAKPGRSVGTRLRGRTFRVCDERDARGDLAVLSAACLRRHPMPMSPTVGETSSSAG
jgi:hypothetical protein